MRIYHSKKEVGLSEAQALSAYYSERNSYAAGESENGLPETEPAENREAEAIGSRIKYSIKTESIKAVERYKCWQAAKAVGNETAGTYSRNGWIRRTAES